MGLSWSRCNQLPTFQPGSSYRYVVFGAHGAGVGAQTAEVVGRRLCVQ